MLKNPSIFYHHLSTFGAQTCQKEHVLCGTDTLNDTTDKSRPKIPPQATLDYSKTTQQKGLLLSMTEETAKIEWFFKHNESDRNVQRKGSTDTVRLATLVKQAEENCNKKLHQSLIKHHTEREIKISCFRLKHTSESRENPNST